MLVNVIMGAYLSLSDRKKTHDGGTACPLNSTTAFKVQDT